MVKANKVKYVFDMLKLDLQVSEVTCNLYFTAILSIIIIEENVGSITTNTIMFGRQGKTMHNLVLFY